jgi:RNA polymerase sigma-70 factor (ECF subfamily)
VSDNQPVIVQRHLDRLGAGDLSARDELIEHICAVLQRLAERMLSQFPGVRRWEGADDVSNSAAMRLWKALEAVKPATPRDFYRLAALQVRRELLDLARHHRGPQGFTGNYESVAPADSDSHVVAEPPDTTNQPERLAQWTDFHRQVERLPDEEREVFDLLFYQELPHAEAAQLLGISESTLRRRWLAARLRLQEALEHGLPA